MMNNAQVKINKRQRNVSRVTVYEACPRQMNENEQEIKMNNKISFDSDSFEIGVDNRCSYTMTNNPNDFVGPIKPCEKSYVRGIKGLVKVNGIGTIQWLITDDDGNTHEISIKNSLLVKLIGGRLLSPQHWAQVADDNYLEQDGTECITRAKTLVMKWDQRKF